MADIIFWNQWQFSIKIFLLVEKSYTIHQYLLQSCHAMNKYLLASKDQKNYGSTFKSLYNTASA